MVARRRSSLSRNAPSRGWLRSASMLGAWRSESCSRESLAVAFPARSASLESRSTAASLCARLAVFNFSMKTSLSADDPSDAPRVGKARWNCYTLLDGFLRDWETRRKEAHHGGPQASQALRRGVPRSTYYWMQGRPDAEPGPDSIERDVVEAFESGRSEYGAPG